MDPLDSGFEFQGREAVQYRGRNVCTTTMCPNDEGPDSGSMVRTHQVFAEHLRQKAAGHKWVSVLVYTLSPTS